MDQRDLPEEYQPVSSLGYVGLFLLSTIPLVGLICTIVFACGGVRKKNIVNFARGQLILKGLVLLIALLFCLLSFTFGILGGMMASM